MGFGGVMNGFGAIAAPISAAFPSAAPVLLPTAAIGEAANGFVQGVVPGLMNLSELSEIEELSYSPNGDYFHSDMPMHHSFMMAELYPHDVWGFESVPTNLYGHGKEAGPALMELMAPPAFAGEVAAAFTYGAFVAPPYDGAWGAPFAGYPAFLI